MDVCARTGSDFSAAKIYGVWLAWAFGGGWYTCALLTSDKEIFQPTRVTEQRSLKHRLEGVQGLKQANMAACNRFPYTHSALPAKNASIWLVHTRGWWCWGSPLESSEWFKVAWFVCCLSCFGGLSQPSQSAMSAAAGHVTCGDRTNSCQLLWSQKLTALTRRRCPRLINMA